MVLWLLPDRWTIRHDQVPAIPADGPLEVTITDFGGQVRPCPHDYQLLLTTSLWSESLVRIPTSACPPPIPPCFCCVLAGGVPANPSGPVLRTGRIRHLVQPAHRGLCCRPPAPPHERDHSVQGCAHHTGWNTSGLHWRRHTSTITSPEGPVSSGTSTMHRLTEQG
jgi:hypothetical protein